MIAVAVLGVLLSVVALACYLRLIVAMYMQPRLEGQLPPLTRRAPAAIAALFCAAGVLYLGCFPGRLLDLIG
jgi:NADH:ubiquinone oxidoreductase subunit 2 (subunit N)